MHWPRLSSLLALSTVLGLARAYEDLLDSDDPVRQRCSGMWGSTATKEAAIEVTFSSLSRGQAALVIYEAQDAKYLGIDVNNRESTNDWSDNRLYVCTLEAVEFGACGEPDLGKFITNRPADAPGESTIFTTSVRFDVVPGATIPEGESARNTGPFRYPISRTGYYCVGIVPITTDAPSDAARTNSFLSILDFQNTFDGQLSASEHPKVAFYFYLFIYYIALSAAWAVLLYQKRGDVLPIQHYVTGTMALLVLETAVAWQYYRYQNGQPHGGISAMLLFLLAALSAGRNAVSFFLLLITSMGYSIVRPSLGGVMIKARLLALIHFIFAMLYSIGLITVPPEVGGAYVVFFILPLAFTLTAFLMWIIWSLNNTIADLGMRKQAYKKSMFIALYRILVGVVAVILAFFFISYVSFFNNLSVGFLPKIWKIRWLLTDGWLNLLYAIAFTAVAWLWRPASHNRRLALSDELPTDETDAEAYDVDTIARRASKDNRFSSENGQVVFDVGADDDDDEDGHDDDDDEKDEESRLRSASGHHALGQDDEEDDVRTPLKKGAKSD